MKKDTMIKELLRARGICVLIPAYDNGGTVSRVVEDVLNYCQDVIVVNDGSTDETLHSLEPFHSLITLVTYGKNRGKGHALKVGFAKALQLGFSYVITMDADGQHYAEDLEKFLKANQKYPGALIVGERNLEGVVRRGGSGFANRFSNFWFCIQTGRHLHDTQTGYRLYPLKKLTGYRFLTSRYEAELELLVFASWSGVPIETVPIEVFYPPVEERVSHFRPVADFARISVLNTALCVLALVYGLPAKLIRTAMKYLRTVYSLLFFLLMCAVSTAALWIYLKFEKNTGRKERNVHVFLYRISRFIMLQHGIPGVKFTRSFLPESEKGRPAVIICNHQSHLDTMCQLIYSPDMVFLTNDWVWNNPFYGFIIRNAEYYPVAEGIDSLLPALKRLAERGYSICVFPEGTRSKTCEIGRFHQGAFYIARQLGLDVLPMCLYGPGKILPKRTYLLNKGRIHIESARRITPAELAEHGDEMKQASFMRKFYKNWYADLCNRIEQDV